jgi:hypothetical protein
MAARFTCVCGPNKAAFGDTTTTPTQPIQVPVPASIRNSTEMPLDGRHILVPGGSTAAIGTLRRALQVIGLHLATQRISRTSITKLGCGEMDAMDAQTVL